MSAKKAGGLVNQKISENIKEFTKERQELQEMAISRTAQVLVTWVIMILASLSLYLGCNLLFCHEYSLSLSFFGQNG